MAANLAESRLCFQPLILRRWLILYRPRETSDFVQSDAVWAVVGRLICVVIECDRAHEKAIPVIMCPLFCCLALQLFLRAFIHSSSCTMDKEHMQMYSFARRRLSASALYWYSRHSSLQTEKANGPHTIIQYITECNTCNYLTKHCEINPVNGFSFGFAEDGRRQQPFLINDRSSSTRIAAAV